MSYPNFDLFNVLDYRESLAPKTCPGVPAGPPPLVADYDEEDESLDSDVSARGKKIRFAPEDNQNSKNNQKVKEFFGKRPILIKNIKCPQVNHFLCLT